MLLGYKLTQVKGKLLKEKTRKKYIENRQVCQ